MRGIEICFVQIQKCGGDERRSRPGSRNCSVAIADAAQQDYLIRDVHREKMKSMARCAALEVAGLIEYLPPWRTRRSSAVQLVRILSSKLAECGWIELSSSIGIAFRKQGFRGFFGQVKILSGLFDAIDARKVCFCQ